MTLTTPSPIVNAATAESRTRRVVGGLPSMFAYRIVRAITSRWISFVPS